MIFAYLHLCVCTDVRMDMYVCMMVCMFVCLLYVCMYVHMYACVNMQILITHVCFQHRSSLEYVDDDQSKGILSDFERYLGLSRYDSSSVLSSSSSVISAGVDSVSNGSNHSHHHTHTRNFSRFHSHQHHGPSLQELLPLHAPYPFRFPPNHDHTKELIGQVRMPSYFVVFIVMYGKI